MAILSNKSFDELKELYRGNFSMGYAGKDFTSKVALISLICHTTMKLRESKPTITHLDVIKALTKNTRIPEHMIYTLALLCEDLSYGCTEFQTFGLSNKEIPNKIRELVSEWLPF